MQLDQAVATVNSPTVKSMDLTVGLNDVIYSWFNDYWTVGHVAALSFIRALYMLDLSNVSFVVTSLSLSNKVYVSQKVDAENCVRYSTWQPLLCRLLCRFLYSNVQL